MKIKWRRLWMKPHTCLPPPPKPLNAFSDSDFEAEAIDLVELEAQCALREGIVFQPHSFFLVILDYPKVEGKKPLIKKFRTPSLSIFHVRWKKCAHHPKRHKVKICVTKGKVSDFLPDSPLSSPPTPPTTFSQPPTSTPSSHPLRSPSTRITAQQYRRRLPRTTSSPPSTPSPSSTIPETSCISVTPPF